MIAQPGLLVDALLVLALLVTATATLLSRDLFRAVVLFIAFGLLMALVWVRLQATDLAMAEAAIGAGLAGVLLLQTVVRMPDRRQAAGLLPWSAALLSLLVFAALVWAVLAVPPPSPQLADALQVALPASGVSHPLTAVLLNFRAYDTFLEVAVLAIAALICLALQAALAEPAPIRVGNRLLHALVIWLAPLAVLVAVYLYWAGSKEPGGAFQAGALLAAGGVLLRLLGIDALCLRPGVALRVGLIAGFGVFLLAGLIGPFTGRPLFAYPAAYAGMIIVSIEAVLSVSIGIILLSLFSTAPPATEQHNER